MSNRAEEKALEAYPIDMQPIRYLDYIDQFGGKTEIDVNSYLRRLFQEGYEQAEKDLGWISVKDRLPEKNGYYITCVAEYYKQEHVPQCVGVTLFNGTYWEDDDDPEEKELVDYWMPIPELPEDEKK